MEEGMPIVSSEMFENELKEEVTLIEDNAPPEKTPCPRNVTLFGKVTVTRLAVPENA
jgi:hypothetical protein